MACFLKLYPFQRFYIADLDAIGGCGDHAAAIHKLLEHYPNIEIWLDKGSNYRAIATKKTADNCKLVLGTESQAQALSLAHSDVILSLDFKHDRLVGDPVWLTGPELWPDNIVVMTLDVVGSSRGPDFHKLAELRLQHANKQLVAAGGVRGIDDLMQLKQLGIDAVLLASALHNGSINAEILNKF